MKTDLQQATWKVLAPLVPRLLTQLERDPHCPNFGCFDRDFWHYKIRDFSSVILQQGGVSVDALSRLHVPENPLFGHAMAPVWADASISFLLDRQLRSGGFEEYYPFESGYPPAAFGLYGAGIIWRERGFPKLPEQQTRAVQRAVDWLLHNPETQALNQEAAGLCALAHVAELPGVNVDSGQLEARLDAFFRAQSVEGWFPEYGGPDLGYLCVTIDCLYDLYALTGDVRAATAMKHAAGYIASMLAPGGRVATMVNSRNTDYLVPYGLARLGQTDATASACVQAMLARLGRPDHFLHATDDRYLCHYIGQSFFRSLAYLDTLTEPAILPCNAPDRACQEFFHAEAGQYVRHERGRSLYFAGNKGGVVYLFGPDGVVDADFGWRMATGKKQAVTHWQSADWQVACEPGKDATLTCQGVVHAQGFAASTPVRHLGLRVLSFLFGNKLIPLLKKKLIFRAASLPISFSRELKTGPEATTLTDTFTGLPNDLTPTPAPQPSMRHVASAARFSPEELVATPEFVVDRENGFVARRILKR